MSRDNRSLLNSRSEAKRIYAQRQEIKRLEKENQQLKEDYDRIYNENCKLREQHNITDISLLDENQQLKKQKDDVVEYIKSKKEQLHHSFDEPDWDYLFICNPDDLLRMLGEIE